MTIVSKLTIPALIGGIFALAAAGLFSGQVHASWTSAEAIAKITGVPMERVLNVRSAPMAEAERIGTLPRNAYVWVESCEGEWCLVERAGTKGWGSADYLTPHAN